MHSKSKEKKEKGGVKNARKLNQYIPFRIIFFSNQIVPISIYPKTNHPFSPCVQKFTPPSLASAKKKISGNVHPGRWVFIHHGYIQSPFPPPRTQPDNYPVQPTMFVPIFITFFPAFIFFSPFFIYPFFPLPTPPSPGKKKESGI